MKAITLSILLVMLIILSANAQTVPDLSTYFETHHFTQTGRYSDCIAYCGKLEKASDKVHLTYIGKTPEARNIPMLIIDNEGLSTPEEVRQTDRIVLLIQAGIHSGEINGKDAGFLLVKDIITKKKYAKLLKQVTILFIPIFNVDGHEHFGPYSRINQNGPDEMGWRTTAQNLNLNRDYIKADAPEMRGWLRMFGQWLPEYFIDIHSTDGADYQYVLTYDVATTGTLDPDLVAFQKNKYLPYVSKQMAKSGYPIFPYVAFRKWHDPRSGLNAGGGNPMLSHTYCSFQNRLSLLIESHMLKDYKTRVYSTYTMLGYTLEYLYDHAEEIKALVAKADDRSSSKAFRSKPFPLAYISDGDSQMVEFKGFDYIIEKSELTGGNWYKYDNTKPRTYTLPYFNSLKGINNVSVPEAYLVPAYLTDVLRKLELHGVSIRYLKNDTKIKVKAYQISNVRPEAKSFEGRQRLFNYTLEEREEDVMFNAGTAVIDMAQPAARIILHILEPKAPSSLLSWGYFNQYFEQKEYSETYVMEKMAREMIAKDPDLKTRFDAYIEQNPQIKGNQWAMLNWFYSQTPYWDSRIQTFPVYRLFDEELLTGLKYR